MKSIFISLMIMILCTPTLLMAATDIVRTDNSEVFVWIFLTIGVGIIIVQLIPTILMLLGISKSTKPCKCDKNKK
jgi:hypothetical protein